MTRNSRLNIANRITSTVAVAGILILPIGLTACAPTRSEANFCKTLKSEKLRISTKLQKQLNDKSGDPLADGIKVLMASLEGLGELQVYTAKLAKVAPSEIQTEAEAVAKSFEDQQKGLSDPLGAMVGAFMTAGPLNAEDDYAKSHCGEGL
jgi:hypothetical protein